MTEDDTEVFEITDFTTASDWERFISRIEEVIHEWKLTNLPSAEPLSKGELSTGEWEEKSEAVDFAGFRFIVTRRHLVSDVAVEKLQVKNGMTKDVSKTDIQAAAEEEEAEINPTVWQDMMSSENDFPGRAHCLCRWYGLRDFVILTPHPEEEDITSESRISLLMSSVSIAINNTGCNVPFFVQVHYQWRKLYYGCFEMAGFRTNFEMVHLKNIPHQYNHLAGLLDVFKGKLASAIDEENKVSVAVRFTYVLQDWAGYSWPQAPPDMESFSASEVGVKDFGELPFGACEDPVSELHLSATWPSLSEEMIVDNDVYSDLDPLQAPHWCIRVRMTESPQCLLGDYLLEFVKLCRRKESTDQLLDKTALENDKEEVDVSGALSRLTEPGYHLPSLGTVVTRATSKLQIKAEYAPIPSDLLNDILLFLFPDAKADEEKFGKGKVTSSSTMGSIASSNRKDSLTSNRESLAGEADAMNQSTSETSVLSEHFQEIFKQFKSAPVNSFAYRLAVCMCIINHSYGGVRAVAHLWQEVVLEMRYRWENNFIVPDLDSGSPNMGCSILHQKFQMLNCCIERKKAREAAYAEARSSSKNPQGPLDSPSSQSLDSTDGTSTGGPDDVDIKREILELAMSSEEEDEFYECDDDVSSRSPRSDNLNENSSVNKSDENKMDVDVSSDSEDKPDKSASTSKMNEGVSETNDDETKTKDVNKADDNATKINKEADDASKSNLPVNDVKLDRKKSNSSQISAKTSQSETDGAYTDSYTHQADGRLKPFDDLKLLNIDEKMYIPITQEPAPMTEDLLEEHAEVLAKLGTSAEGAHLRARMQSACLLSDMESFKAANPGACLGDFVRWYSPRDWVEVEEVDDDGNVTVKSQLSARMQIPGNMWVEVWQSAKPVPARRQRRLFDDTKEAEKVLHWLAAMNPADVAMRLMPMLVHAAIAKLSINDESSLPLVRKVIDQITNKATKAMRAPCMEVKRFEDLVRHLTSAEVVITRVQSLKNKFEEETRGMKNISCEDLKTFVSELLDKPDVNLLGASRSPMGSVIHKLFQAAQKSNYMLTEDDQPLESDDSARTTIPDFPPPVGKEYILRNTCHRPAPWSRSSPQRMYCVLMKDDFRLAGAFSSDTTFQ